MKRIMRRWSGRIKPEREVSRWLIEMRKEPALPAEEEPLIVPKVIKQYTRKKKVCEPVNTLGTPQDVAVAGSGESNVPQNNAMKEVSHVKIKQEPTENEFLIMNNAQTSGSSEVKDIKINRENISEIVSSACNVSDGQQQQSKMEIILKLEQTDDYEDVDSDQKNLAASHSELGKTVRVTPNTECDSNTSDKMDECKNMELEFMKDASVMGQTFHSQYKTLLTEEINIKEEIVSDNDDSELTVTSNVKEEPADEAVTRGEQTQVTRITSGSQSMVTAGSGVIKAYGKNPNMVALKKCYLVAVNVAPDTSGDRRGRHVTLLPGTVSKENGLPLLNLNAQGIVSKSGRPVFSLANTRKMVDPGHLAGLKVVSRTRIFGCDMCGRDFTSKLGVRQHIAMAHAVATPFVCHCGDKFTHNFLLLAHNKTHCSSEPFSCDMCPKNYRSVRKYASHLNTHLKERFYACPICVRRYTVLANLKRHAAMHKQSDTFQCKVCSQSYRCVTDLRRHIESDHGEKVEYPCYVCSQTLSSNAELIAHVHSHDNALHECAFCSRRFNDVRKWEAHSAIHIELLDAIEPVLRPHVCAVCNKRFDYRSVLRTHMSSHTAERPYKCKKCSKTFKTQSAVSEHEKGHDRPYPCAECSARFAKRNSLSRHLLLHSGERPHACAHCARRFTQRSAMLQHVQRFHTPGLKRARRGRRK